MCQQGSDIARIQKSREKEDRSGEREDKKKAIKGATDSYKYVVVSIVSGNLRFILPVLHIPKISNDTDYYVKELLIFVKSLHTNRDRPS